jgi:hypothetical protein
MSSDRQKIWCENLVPFGANWCVSNSFEQIFPEYPLMGSHSLENPVQGPDTKRRMRWNHDPVMTWYLSLENDMAADLMDKRVPPQTAQVAS